MEDRFVIRVENGTTHRISVKRGVVVKNLVEIFGDLKEGDQILVNPADNIQSGESVKIQ
jgi:hypothetical protein